MIGLRTATHTHAMPFGTALLPGGTTRFRLWAPSCADVELETNGMPEDMPASVRRPMQALPQGWHELVVADAAPGTRYRFAVRQRDGTMLRVPDPASRSNPDGVHEASVVVDPAAYVWNDEDWRGRPWTEAVVYELHLGTFTAEGSFTAAGRRLQALATLGITAIELMPLAAFPGRRNWGYDGVLPFAPAACYGTPDELKAFINAAHSLGLMVLLDVVYNHFGPEGNYLHAYAPQFFNPAHHTPWGAAINFDGDMNRSVRDFFIHNALYWVEEYRFDGLRMDAVHAIHDDSTPDIVSEIALALRQGPGRDRHIHLVLENDANQSRYLERTDGHAPRLATAQWNDDLHHALHVVTTDEQDGYYADYLVPPSDLNQAQDVSPRLRHLGRALAQGFAYQGEHSPFRNAVRGEPSAQLPPAAFVGFLQNHDQVGNRALGERNHMFAERRFLRAAYACLLLSPQVPMLFMGEEFDASTPFLFFCDFGGELAQAVANGRRDEFKAFAAFAGEAARARIPDPNAISTFAASRLRWEEREASPHREQLELTRHLLLLRQCYLVPSLSGMTHGGHHHVEGGLLRVEWRLGDTSSWRLVVNFAAHDLYTAALPAGEPVYVSGVHDAAPAGVRFEPGGVAVSLGPAHG